MSSAISSRTGDPNRLRAQFSFERLQQVLVTVLFDLVVGVAGDAERVVLHDFHAGEEHRKEGGDQFFHRQIPDHPRPSLPSVAPTAFEFDEAVDVVGHLDPGEMLAPSSGCFTVTARFRASTR